MKDQTLPRLWEKFGHIGGLKTSAEKTGLYGLSDEKRTEIRRKGGMTTKARGVGIFSLTDQERKELGKKVGVANRELGRGICGLSTEQRRNRMLMHKENGTGAFARSSEEMSESSRKAIATSRERGTGFFGLSKEKRLEIGRKAGDTQRGRKQITHIHTGIVKCPSPEEREALLATGEWRLGGKRKGGD